MLDRTVGGVDRETVALQEFVKTLGPNEQRDALWLNRTLHKKREILSIPVLLTILFVMASMYASTKAGVYGVYVLGGGLTLTGALGYAVYRGFARPQVEMLDDRVISYLESHGEQGMTIFERVLALDPGLRSFAESIITSL